MSKQFLCPDNFFVRTIFLSGQKGIYHKVEFCQIRDESICKLFANRELFAERCLVLSGIWQFYWGSVVWCFLVSLLGFSCMALSGMWQLYWSSVVGFYMAYNSPTGSYLFGVIWHLAAILGLSCLVLCGIWLIYWVSVVW